MREYYPWSLSQAVVKVSLPKSALLLWRPKVKRDDNAATARHSNRTQQLAPAGTLIEPDRAPTGP